MVSISAMAEFDLGLSLAGLERHEEALEAFQEALTCFNKMRWPWEAGKTRQEMAQVHLARGAAGDQEKAQLHLQEAHEIFKRIRADPMRAKTESLLVSIGG